MITVYAFVPPNGRQAASKLGYLRIEYYIIDRACKARTGSAEPTRANSTTEGDAVLTLFFIHGNLTRSQNNHGKRHFLVRDIIT